MAKKTEMEEYQDSPRYTGYEDYTPVGRKAIKAYNKAARGDDMDVAEPHSPATSRAGRSAAQEVIRKDREQTKPLERVDEMGNAYKKGGKVSSASRRADGIATKGKTRGRIL
jgi:hypothetical protein